MRGGTIQINWHDTKPVLTLDFHPLTGTLATGGSDTDIKLWVITPGESQQQFPLSSYKKSLSYHSSTVNVLRFSPSGELLASGADGGELVIWKLQSTDDWSSWKVLKTLLFHRKDVLDLQWSPDNGHLISGSVDNSCLIWDVNKGSVHQMLDAHLHYVQGVAWDPLDCYVASLSSDRTCRIYVNKPQIKQKGFEKINFVCQHVLTKLDVQNVDESKPLLAKSHLFHDETLNSFFRRLSWSPDGSFLLVPAGICKFPSAPDTVNAAFIISRNELSRPAIYLPGANKPIVAVRFCPVLFCLRGSKTEDSLFRLPYRVIFAVATLNSVYIYDSESTPPIVIVAGLHYAAITDLSWSPNAKYIALSSQDGYCSVLEFDNDELGVPFSHGGQFTENIFAGGVDRALSHVFLHRQKLPSLCASNAAPSSFDLPIESERPDEGIPCTLNMKANNAETYQEKPAQPALARTPDSNKPTKKRIAPIPIN